MQPGCAAMDLADRQAAHELQSPRLRSHLSSTQGTNDDQSVATRDERAPQTTFGSRSLRTTSSTDESAGTHACPGRPCEYP